MKEKLADTCKNKKWILIITAFVIVAVAICGILIWQRYAEKQKIKEALESIYPVCEKMNQGDALEAKKLIEEMEEQDIEMTLPILQEKFCYSALVNDDCGARIISDPSDQKAGEQECKRIKDYIDLGEKLNEQKENEEVTLTLELLNRMVERYNHYADKAVFLELTADSNLGGISSFIREGYLLVEQIASLGSDYLYMVYPQVDAYIQQFNNWDFRSKYGRECDEINALYNATNDLVNSVAHIYNGFLDNNESDIQKASNEWEKATGVIQTYLEKAKSILEEQTNIQKDIIDRLEKQLSKHPEEKVADMITELENS